MRGRSMLAVIGVLASATPAIAGVAWHAPAECGTADALTAQVGVQLGRAPGEVTADVAIVAADGEYRAALGLEGAPSRALTGATCGEVVDAIALIVALAIRDAELATPPIEPPIVAPPTTPRGARRLPRVGLGVRVAADAMTLPAPALGIGPALELAVRRWSAGVAVAIWDGNTANRGTLRATDVDLISGAVELCHRRGPGRACGVATAGVMTGRGFDEMGGASATRWWSAAGAAVGGSRAFGPRLAVGAGVEALVSLARPRFVFDDGREGYRAPAVTIRLGITLSLRILGGR